VMKDQLPHVQCQRGTHDIREIPFHEKACDAFKPRVCHGQIFVTRRCLGCLNTAVTWYALWA
jgi:hypothetical protein